MLLYAHKLILSSILLASPLANHPDGPPAGNENLCHVGGRCFFGMNKRHVDQVLAQKPGLQLIGPQHLADEKVIRAIVAQFGDASRLFSHVADDELVSVQQT